MTNSDNSVFREYSDIITSYQDSPKLGGNIPHSNNNSRCLNCKQPLVNTNFSPFCGAICLGAWNSDRAKDAKGSEKNTMSLLEFSKVFEQ